LPQHEPLFVPVTAHSVFASVLRHTETNDVKTIQELQDDLSHKVRSAKDINDRAETGNRELTAEERKTVKELLGDSEQLKAQIKQQQEDETLRGQIDAELTNLASPAPRKVAAAKPNDGDVPAGDVRVKGYTQRFGALKAFTDKSFGNHAEAAAYKCGQWLLARFFDNGKSKRWCEQNGVDIRAAMSEGVNTAGGHLVPDEMSQAIIDLREQYGVFRANARVRPMSSDTQIIPRLSGHVTAAFTTEATAGSPSDMSFDQVQLVAKKLYALTYLSTELAEDAVIGVVDQITRDFAWAFALKEDQCGFTGDG
jgi:HK97 family phage major capsid protein